MRSLFGGHAQCRDDTRTDLYREHVSFSEYAGSCVGPVVVAGLDSLNPGSLFVAACTLELIHSLINFYDESMESVDFGFMMAYGYTQAHFTR
jgi:hypothetical protein